MNNVKLYQTSCIIVYDIFQKCNWQVELLIEHCFFHFYDGYIQAFVPLNILPKNYRRGFTRGINHLSIRMFEIRRGKEIHTVECQLCSPSPQVLRVMLETERQKEVEVTIA